jgi:cell division protein FtsL
MKLYALIILAAYLFSCTNNKMKTKQATTNAEIRTLNEDIQIDTSQIPKTVKTIKKWSDVDDYYGVYRFSKDITGIGFEIDESTNALLDSLVKNVNPEVDSVNHVIDKTGSYNIFYSNKLSKSILENDTSREFFIYCTRGTTKAKIEKVLYGSTDCTAILILKLSKIDTQLFGHPLIASKKRFDLIYKENRNLQNGLEKYQYIWDKKSDYKDSIIAKQFASNSKLFLAYSDDFNWFASQNKSKCLFPSRMVFKLNGKSAKLEWIKDLDLFGIPCD